MIYALTGHRPDKLGGEYDYKGPYSKAIYDALVGLIMKDWPTKCISGMALGADTIWANAAIKCMVPLIAAIPFRDQDCKWPRESKRVYGSLLRRASEIVIVSDGGYSPYKMQIRNQYMVDHCDKLVAVWDGTDGGTANCVRYAEKQGVEIIRINPKELV